MGRKRHYSRQVLCCAYCLDISSVALLRAANLTQYFPLLIGQAGGLAIRIESSALTQPVKVSLRATGYSLFVSSLNMRALV